jgi:hypothetical protein
MLLTLRVQPRFVEFVVTTRVTVPANPFRGLTVMLEVAVAPELAVALVGLAVTV